MSDIGAVILIFLILLFMGLPVAFVLGVSSILYFFISDSVHLSGVMVQRMFSGMNSFVIMAIPLFIMAGEMLNRGQITERLVKFADLVVGRMRGGLAQANVVTSMLFAGITGSALSDVAALGSIFIPSMEKSGYDREFSTAVTAASAIQGPIIPPSVPAVLVASATGTSLGALFLGGAIPGFLVGIGCMILVTIYSRKRAYPRRERRFSRAEVFASIKGAFLALLTPVIILGGIVTGMFTPTEAAAIAVLYAGLLNFVVYRILGWSGLWKLLKDVVKATSKIYLIIATATAFSWILSMENVPAMLSNFLFNITDNHLVMLLVVNLFLLFWGMWMDTAPSIMLLAPILFPITQAMGIHPIHFGVIMIVNLMIGQLSPPFGMSLFTALAVGKVGMMGLMKVLWPFFILNIIILGLVTYIPEISLFLPRLLGFIN